MTWLEISTLALMSITTILCIVNQGRMDILEMRLGDIEKDIQKLSKQLKNHTDALEKHTGEPVYEGEPAKKPAKVKTRKDREDLEFSDDKEDWVQ
jgi:hypothetical protein